MTGRSRDVDALLGAYFEDGPSEAPDRAIEATVELLARTRQERRRWQPWRFEMSNRMRLGLAAAAAIVVLVVGAAILGRPQSPPVASSPSPSAAQSPAASSSLPAGSPTTGPSPTSPTLGAQVGAGQRAASRVDAALRAASQAGVISTADDGLLGADSDAVRLSLGERSLELARTNYASLAGRLAGMSPAPSGPTGAELRDAVAALGNALNAVTLPTGVIPAGSYVSSFFARPFVVLGLGDGWTRYLDDGEVFALRRGKTTLAFHHTATAATPAAMVTAVGQGGSGEFTQAPTPVTIGVYAGLVGQTPVGATLWYDAALNAYDPAPGDIVRIWVLTVEQRVLTIELLGPPAEVAAGLPDVERILATFVAYEPPA